LKTNLRLVFPECADKAVSFYRKLASFSAALQRVLQERPISSPPLALVKPTLYFPRVRLGLNSCFEQTNDPQHLDGASLRFRRFVDVQLQALALADSAEVAYLYAVLHSPRRAEVCLPFVVAPRAGRGLADSIKQSEVGSRLDSPVLRLSYDSKGRRSVLTLERRDRDRIEAIVSNLTCWDTYGKLVGLNRTPAEIRIELKSLRVGRLPALPRMDDDAERPLVSNHVLTLSEWQDGQTYNPENNQLFFFCFTIVGRPAASGNVR